MTYTAIEDFSHIANPHDVQYVSLYTKSKLNSKIYIFFKSAIFVIIVVIKTLNQIVKRKKSKCMKCARHLEISI